MSWKKLFITFSTNKRYLLLFDLFSPFVWNICANLQLSMHVQSCKQNNPKSESGISFEHSTVLLRLTGLSAMIPA